MTREEILRRIEENIDAAKATNLILELLDVLYGVGAPKDMGADQIGAVVNVLDDYGLVSDEED